MSYEKSVALKSVYDIMKEEKQLNQYLFEYTGEIIDIQLHNVLDKLDNLHKRKKELLNYLQDLK